MIQIRRRTAVLAIAAFLAFAAVATTSLVLTLTRPANAGPGFSDTPAWAAAQINWLAANAIATGYSDGTFKPNDNITRAQAAFWFGNYNNAVQLVPDNTDPGPDNKFHMDKTCPAGKRAIAGGGNTSEPGLVMTDSYPISASVWRVRWKSDNDVNVNPTFINIWALCAPNTIP
jgi:hypothetical protein